MEDTCHFHPTRPAHWFCPFCKIGLCPDCVIQREKGGYTKGEHIHLCQKCNRITEWIGAETLIEPFWKHLPGFFAYPFRLQPLILILALSIIGLFGLILIESGGFLLGILLLLAVVLALLKYSYEVLNETARGNLNPPAISAKTISENLSPVVKQLVLIVIITIIVGMVTNTAGAILGHVAFLFFKLFFYAMLILLVTTESLLHALNPLLFVRLAFRIGWGYLVMYFFLFLLGDAPYYLLSAIAQVMPENYRFFAFIFALSFCYYTIIAYHLMGYVLLQYHQEIGYKIDYEDFSNTSGSIPSLPQPEDPNAVILKQINPLIQEGKLDEAIAFIKQQTAETGISDLTLSERYFNLLKVTKRKDELLQYAVTHLRLLVEGHQINKAHRLYVQCVKHSPNFKPEATALFKIGNWLSETGKIAEAITTYNLLVKTYPRNDLVPLAYFRSAQLFNDRLMRPEKAIKILKGLLKRYPEHHISPKVKAYLAHI